MLWEYRMQNTMQQTIQNDDKHNYYYYYTYLKLKNLIFSKTIIV